MNDNFRVKLTLVMILFSICLTFAISFIDVERVEDNLKKANDRKLELVEDNIRTSLSSIDNALYLFEDELKTEMSEKSQLLIDKYVQNPNFDEWDFKDLSKKLEMDVYILNAQNDIIYTNYPEKLTMKFSECCIEFDGLLHQRRMTGAFYHDGMDVQQQTGELVKFSFQGTPDRKYIIELGVPLRDHDIIKRFSVLDAVKKLEEKYLMIDNITIFNDEGYRLGRADGEIRIANENRKYFLKALNQKKKIKIEETSGGKTVKRLYVHYEAEVGRGSSTERVVRITYNENELEDTLRAMRSAFIWQLVVTTGLSIVASILLSFMLSKPLHLAFHDALTGIKNRASYEILAKRALNKEGKIGLLIIDLDNFKKVNDLLGHDTGDKLLISVAKTLSRISTGKCTPFRFGGDEFVVVVEDLKSEKELEKIAYSIIEGITTTTDAYLINSDGFLSTNTELKKVEDIIHLMKVSISIGGAITLKNEREIGELFKKADKALYCTKNKGKNGYTLYAENM